MAKIFDPADHTVDEVNDHLEKATAAERARVLAAEEAEDGKGRVTILNGPYGYAQPDEDDVPGKHPFVAGATEFATEVTGFLGEVREGLDALTQAHVEVTASHDGAPGLEPVAYQLARVGSVLPDLERALGLVSAVAASLTAAAATVEATDA